MHIPVLNIATPSANDQDLVASLDTALRDVGFMMATNLPVDQTLLASVFAASRSFFTSPISAKRACAYQSASENFGYQGVNEENLDPTAPADMKETFTMRNILHRPIADNRWPSSEFRDVMQTFYQAALDAGFTLQRLLAKTLGVDPEFFVRCHSGENVTLRLLHYPAHSAVAADQMGAGAHTDYGLMTLLFQDKVGGLQVRGPRNKWVNATPIEGAVVINSGDLLERWTNGRYRSTLHRVIPTSGQTARFSIAMFIDPDSDTNVVPLDSCVDGDHPAQFSPVTAGDHLQQKIEASHKDRFRS